MTLQWSAPTTHHSPLTTYSLVELHIEELVLHGFAAQDRHAFADAVERELARLLAEQGVPPGLARDGDVARLDGGRFLIEVGARPEAIGVRVGQAVYGGLNG